MNAEGSPSLAELLQTAPLPGASWVSVCEAVEGTRDILPCANYSGTQQGFPIFCSSPSLRTLCALLMAYLNHCCMMLRQESNAICRRFT